MVEETEGWTVDTLHDHLKGVLTERDLRYQQRFDAQQDALVTVPPLNQQIAQVSTRLDGYDELMQSKFVTFRTLIDSQAEKVALALASADKAVGKAEVSFERQVSALSVQTEQLRAAISDLVRGDYLQQALESRDALIAACTERIRELELGQRGAASTQLGGQQKVGDMRATIVMAVAAATLILGVIVFIANILTKG